MFHVTIFDAAGTPLVVEVSHEVFQVFAEYDREMERQRKEDSVTVTAVPGTPACFLKCPRSHWSRPTSA